MGTVYSHASLQCSHQTNHCKPFNLTEHVTHSYSVFTIHPYLAQFIPHAISIYCNKFLLHIHKIYKCSCTKTLSDMIEEIQLEAARTAIGAKRRSSHAALYFELGWISLYDRRKMHNMFKLYTILNHLTSKLLE